MIRRLFLSLLTDLLIAVALLAASAILPLASFWLCHSSMGGQIVFWVGPWTTAVWTLLIVQLGGSPFWKGRAHVLAWCAAHGRFCRTPRELLRFDMQPSSIPATLR